MSEGRGFLIERKRVTASSGDIRRDEEMEKGIVCEKRRWGKKKVAGIFYVETSSVKTKEKKILGGEIEKYIEKKQEEDGEGGPLGE